MDHAVARSAREDRRGPASLLHVSNLLTYGSLLCGVAAITGALWFQSAAAAGAAMALGVLADTFDGRFARRFSRTPLQRNFGVQLDSLTDVVVSGVAPVVVLLALVATGASGAMKLAWGAAAFAYLVSVVTRLGYYNVTHADDRGDDAFVGVPTPVATLLISTMLLSPTPWGALLVMTSASILMISPIRVPRPHRTGLALFAGWAVALVLTHALRF